MNYSLSFSASCIEAFYLSYNSTNSHFNECFNAMKSELSINPRCRTKNGGPILGRNIVAFAGVEIGLNPQLG